MAETLPLFPLAAVLLPGASLPLHIFEPRYRTLTTDLMTNVVPDRRFGVITKKPDWMVDVQTVGQVHEVGCAALLREAKRLPDGRFDIVATGERRFRLLEIDEASAPYLIGSVEWIPDSRPTGKVAALLPALTVSAKAAHRRYCEAAWDRGDWSAPPEDTDVRQLAHLLAADCLLAMTDRQRLLAETCPARRLRLVRQLLHREAGLLTALHAVPAPASTLDLPASRN